MSNGTFPKLTNNLSFVASVTQVPTCTISVLYWVIQTVIFPVTFVLYMFVLYIIFRHKEFTNTYYTLVLALGVADVITNLYVIHAFLCCFFADNYLGKLPDRVITFLFAGTGWYFGIYLNVFIALNRFVAIVFFVRYKEIWTVYKTKVVILACLGLGVLTASPYTFLTTVFDIEAKAPNFFGNVSMVQFEVTFDYVSSFLPVTFFLIIYTISVGFSIVRIRNFAGGGVKMKYIREIKMMVQGMLVGTITIIVEIFSHVPVMGDLSWVITTILMTGLNPLIYLALDSRIRQQLANLCSSNARKVSNAFETATSHTVEMQVKNNVHKIPEPTD